MPVIAIVGAQWGDEGKGKIVDMVAEKARIVIRYSGGDNAGHTVVNNLGEFKLHLIPCGIFYPGNTCIIGNGVVINPAVLLAELEYLKKNRAFLSQLFISDRANIIMPYHIRLDSLEEEALGGKAIGTTRKGVGPAFTDKAARLAIRAGDLLDKEYLFSRLELVLEHKNRLFEKVYGVQPLSLDAIYKEYCVYGERLAPYIRETTGIINEAIDKNEPVMLEGAQGMLLDPDFGTYPFGTSSSPMAAGASLGAGISPIKITSVLGVYKAYCTRVGGGPMPTELTEETGEKLRQCAHEYGTTTGRARRCGWFDGVAARFSSRLNGYTGMAVTRFDILDNFSKLKICTAYKVNGETINEFPSSISILEKCEPVYEELEGWMTPTGNIRKYDLLPAQAKQYIQMLESICGCPTSVISVGPEREQTITRTPVI
jgi:adenylosuccinate synthase